MFIYDKENPIVESYITKLRFNIISMSRVAHWKRAGPITQRSEDQNLALLTFLFLILFHSLLVISC